MGYAMMRSFDTIEEAEAYKLGLIDSEIWSEDRIIIFDDEKNKEELGCKRYTVNIE